MIKDVDVEESLLEKAGFLIKVKKKNGDSINMHFWVALAIGITFGISVMIFSFFYGGA